MGNRPGGDGRDDNGALESQGRDPEDFQTTAVVTPPVRSPDSAITRYAPNLDPPQTPPPPAGPKTPGPDGAGARSKTPAWIGRYQVLERVGRGGMGVLYRGVDPVLDREVAIKVMLADFSEDTEQLRPRFYREARAIAKLQHRNIVTVFEFAEDGTTPYIVMEFLRGTSLAARFETGPPLTPAVRPRRPASRRATSSSRPTRRRSATPWS